MGRRSGRATKRWRPGRFRAREPSQRGSARKKPVRRRGRTGRSLDAVAFEGTQRIAGPLHEPGLEDLERRTAGADKWGVHAAPAVPRPHRALHRPPPSSLPVPPPQSKSVVPRSALTDRSSGPDRRDVTNHQPRPSPPAERREGDFFRRRRTPEPRASALRSESGLSASGESVRPERRAGAPGPESKGGRKGPLQLRSRSPDLGATSARPVRPRRASPRPRRRRLAREEAPAPAHPSPAPGPMRSARR
jgi:hypothetical protein